MVLAMLALLAQLCMVQSSTRHLADMATQALFNADICSVHDQGSSGPQDGDEPMGAMQHCPICGVAGASFMASSSAALALPPGPHGLATSRHYGAPAPQPDRLRPPAQGPPHALA